MYVKATKFAIETKSKTAIDAFGKYLEKYCRPYPINGVWRPGFTKVTELFQSDEYHLSRHIVTMPNDKTMTVNVWRTNHLWYASAIEAANTAQNLGQDVEQYKVDVKTRTRYVSISTAEAKACGYATRKELIETLKLEERDGRFFNNHGEYFIATVQIEG